MGTTWKNIGENRAKQWRIATITKLIMASQEILILLGVVVFFFSALGMQLWGGTLYATHPALEGARKGPTDFSSWLVWSMMSMFLLGN